MSKVRTLDTRQKPAAALDTPTDLSSEAVRDISKALNGLLADAFALYTGTSAARISATITCCSTSRPIRFMPRQTRLPNGCGK